MDVRLLKGLCLCLVLTLFLLSPLAAENKPEKVGLNGFDEFVSKAMEEWKVPGLAVSIVKDGEVIYSSGFGYRDLEQKLEVTPETLFAIGSCSKAFTAVTMGILVDDGKLEWDKPVREYLPTFKLKDPFVSERMTPRDLVYHRSGLPRHEFMWYGSSAAREALFNRLQYLELSKDIRTAFQYNNLMFMTAGYMVGRIAETTWEDFVDVRIFKPLNMKDSNFSVENSKKASDFSLPYGKKEEEVVEIPFRNIDTIGPAGSINSNVMDMANWLLLNLGNGKFGEKQIISEASLKEIHAPQVIMSTNLQEDLFYSMYGMGWVVTAYRGHLLLLHGGGIDGFLAHVSFMPKENIGIVLLTNLSPNPLTQIIPFNAYDRLLGLDQAPWIERIRQQEKKAREEAEKAKKEKDEDRVPNATPSHPLEAFVGDYENPGYGVFSVVKDGERLKAKYNSFEFPLDHYHFNIFEMEYEMFNITMKVSFFTDIKGNIGSLAVQMEPTVDDIVFIRLPEKASKEPNSPKNE